MKKFYVITSIFLLIGIILTTYGLANSGYKTILIADGKTEIFRENKINKKYPIDDIKNLKINIINSEVRIIEGDEFKITQKAENTDNIKVENHNGNVTVDEGNKFQRIPDSGLFQVIGLHGPWTNNEVTITVPTKKKITEVNASLEGGFFTIEGDVVETLIMKDKQPENITLNNVDLGPKTNINFNQPIPPSIGLNGFEITNSSMQGKFNLEYTNILTMDINRSKFKNADIYISQGDIDIKNSSLTTSKIDGLINVSLQGTKIIGQNSITIDGQGIGPEGEPIKIRLSELNDFGIKAENSNLSIEYKNVENMPTDKSHGLIFNPQSKNQLEIFSDAGTIFLDNIK